MREIKFRAWDKEGLEMYYLGSDMNSFWNNPRYELMQCTGLMDKHCGDIYEGDVVHNSDFECNFIVNFDEYTARFVACVYADKCDYGLDEYVDDSCFIIGNIFENPELLEEA